MNWRLHLASVCRAAVRRSAKSRKEVESLTFVVVCLNWFVSTKKSEKLLHSEGAALIRASGPVCAAECQCDRCSSDRSELAGSAPYWLDCSSGAIRE